ncbi:MAG: siroheme synthase [Rhodospirillales bacterium]|nr:siroheme synthase [Rhodospirillales bacterium]
MFPVALDLARLPVVLAGSGRLALRRLALLDDAGAGAVRVFCPDAADAALQAAAGARFCVGLPDAAAIAAARLLLVAGLDGDASAALAALARARGVLVNVEDDLSDCDFHVPAMHRAGDLLIAVSTGGQSPTLAQAIRARIAACFGPEWAGRLARAAALRRALRADGADGRAVGEAVRALAANEAWFASAQPGAAEGGPE